MPNAGNPREPTQGGYTAHALRQKQTPYAPSERRPRHTPQTTEYTDYYKHGGLRRVSGDLLRDADESRGEPCILARAAYAVPGVLSLGYSQKERSCVLPHHYCGKSGAVPADVHAERGSLQRNAPLARIRAGVPVVRDGRRQVLRDVRA